MLQPLRKRLSTFPRVPVALTGIVAAAVLTGGLLLLFGAPPRTVTLATGPPGSAHAAIGERYKAILARSGITLKLLPTAGAEENLSRLRDPQSGVSAAFVISGLPGARAVSGLASLGTIAYEPLWLFERSAARGIAEGVAGKRISLDVVGSGTQALVQRLFQLTGLSVSGAEVLHLSPADAAERLLRGEIDVLALLAAWDSPIVRHLAADPRVSIFSYRRADALVALNPDLRKLTLPAGIGNFAANLPPADVTLVAPKASLLVREDLHDAIQYLLLDAASKVHAEPGIFHQAGAFPAAEAIEFPLSDEATRYYKSGRPFLQRHLPFWAAVWVERLLFVVLPLLGILVPVVSGVGSAYRNLMQQRILAFYGELRLVEREIAAGPKPNHADLLRRLEDLEHRASRLRVPVQFAQMLYSLRSHVQEVRDRLATDRPGQT
ncbi:MAG TPA: TAXI family TRAP transporter solute-binding subunit [Anaeromyxobacteraceae bacterium]|nr:TAXI family TRAP transporter solute-binding subunit [Anaeromyxobacteraceae bacterium]